MVLFRSYLMLNLHVTCIWKIFFPENNVTVKRTNICYLMFTWRIAINPEKKNNSPETILFLSGLCQNSRTTTSMRHKFFPAHKSLVQRECDVIQNGAEMEDKSIVIPKICNQSPLGFTGYPQDHRESTRRILVDRNNNN